MRHGIKKVYGVLRRITPPPAMLRRACAVRLILHLQRMEMWTDLQAHQVLAHWHLRFSPEGDAPHCARVTFQLCGKLTCACVPEYNARAGAGAQYRSLPGVARRKQASKWWKSA